MNDRKDDNVKMLNDINPNHRRVTHTEQLSIEMNRHERRKEAAAARRKKRSKTILTTE